MGVAVGISTTRADRASDHDVLRRLFSAIPAGQIRFLRRSGPLAAGVASATKPYLGWACGFADFDNDGKRDLWLANGHVYPRSPHYFQPFVVMQNQGAQVCDGFSVSSRAGQLLPRRLRGRFR